MQAEAIHEVSSSGFSETAMAAGAARFVRSFVLHFIVVPVLSAWEEWVVDPVEQVFTTVSEAIQASYDEIYWESVRWMCGSSQREFYQEWFSITCPEPWWKDLARLAIALSVLGVAAGCAAYFVNWRLYFSEMLYANAHTYELEGNELHRAMRDRLDKVKLRPATGVPESHSHREAAMNRSSATSAIVWMITTLGLTPYSWQMSNVDRLRGRRGYRDWHWPWDTGIRPGDDDLDDSSVVYMIDVAFHMEMAEIMALDKCVVMYEEDPKHAANEVADRWYHFNEDNELVTEVRGGAGYTHRIWNWSQSVATYWTGWTYRRYSVERRECPGEKQIVVLCPVNSWTGPLAWLAWLLLGVDPIQRFEPVVPNPNGDTLVRFWRDGNVVLGKVGVQGSVTIPEAEYEDIRRAIAISSVKVGVATATRWIEKRDQRAAIIALEHLTLDGYMPRVIGTTCVQFMHVDSDPDESRDLARAYASPAIIGGSGSQKFDDVAAGAGTQRRIDSAGKEPTNLTMYLEFAEAFSKHLEEGGAKAHMPTIDDIRAWQNSPSQRAIWASIEDLPPLFDKEGQPAKDVILVDPKAEASNGGAVRLICPVKDATRYQAAIEAAAIQAYLSEFLGPCFSPGHTNVAVDAHVAEICAGADEVAGGDIVLCDGSQNPCTFAGCAFIYRRICPWGQAYRSQFNREINFKGHKRDIGCRVISGGAFTTVHNTLTVLIILYVACRLAGMADDQAFDWVKRKCAASGDDSLARLDPRLIAEAADFCGMTYEPEKFKRGEVVTYLARHYSPWSGDQANCCDIVRALSKLHVTARGKDVDDHQVFYDRLAGWAVVDPHTPFYRHLVNAGRRLNLLGLGTVENSDNWRARTERDGDARANYVHRDWMDDVCYSFDLDEVTFETHCKTAQSVAELLQFPAIGELKIKGKHFPQIVIHEDGHAEKLEPAKVIPANDRPLSLEEKRQARADVKRAGFKDEHVQRYFGFAKRILKEKARWPTQEEQIIFWAKPYEAARKRLRSNSTSRAQAPKPADLGSIRI